MDYQLLSKWMINLYQTGLSTTNQLDYQPLYKWMINLYQIGISTTFQMDYQPLIQMDDKSCIK